MLPNSSLPDGTVGVAGGAWGREPLAGSAYEAAALAGPLPVALTALLEAGCGLWAHVLPILETWGTHPST